MSAVHLAWNRSALGKFARASSGFSSSLSLARTPAPIIDGKSGKTIEKNPVLTPAAENRWGVFVSGANGVFTVHGPGIGHNSALIHSAIEVRWNDRWSSFVGYDSNVGRGDYDSVSGRLTYRF
jgi:hypothetical protein